VGELPERYRCAALTPGMGRHSPEPKRVASRSASSASEESIPATRNRSMAVERTWETSALVSRSLRNRGMPASPHAGT